MFSAAAVGKKAEQTLGELGFDAVAFFPTAAAENIGIAELRSHLLQLAERPRPQQQRFRLNPSTRPSGCGQ